jgi:hypothetical protein
MASLMMEMLSAAAAPFALREIGSGDPEVFL